MRNTFGIERVPKTSLKTTWPSLENILHELKTVLPSACLRRGFGTASRLRKATLIDLRCATTRQARASRCATTARSATTARCAGNPKLEIQNPYRTGECLLQTSGFGLLSDFGIRHSEFAAASSTTRCL